MTPKMKTEYWTKEVLYNHIDNLRLQLGISLSECDYPINSLELGKQHCNNLTIEKIPFPTHYICGILYKGNDTTSIALNSNREECMQNFDCMHELIHYFFHDISCCQLMCSEKNIQQDLYIEWQANEGAAQFLVPYQLFIPKYLELERKYAYSFWEDDSIEELANFFNVSYGVIKNRINSLKTEIMQYKQGQSLKSLVVISKTKAVSLGLDSLKLKQLYCKKCLTAISDKYDYCPICNNDLLNHSFFKQKKRKGAGFMIYKNEIELDNEKKAKMCPKCHNEEILNGSHCKICGFELFNRCTNFEADEYGNIIGGCAEICDANARYCHKCGFKTTFFENGLLCNYKDYKEPIDSTHKQMWNERVETLKKEGKIMLYVNLMHTDLLEIDNNTIGINYANGLEKFTKTIITKEENKDFIKKMVQDIYGIEKEIKFYDKNIDIDTKSDIFDLPF